MRKLSSADLITIIAPQRCNMEWMNEPCDGTITPGVELRAHDGNDVIPLPPPTGNVVVVDQKICRDQGAPGLRRKRRSGIARLRSGQQGAQFGARPEGLHGIVSRIFDPHQVTLMGEAVGWGTLRQFTVSCEVASRIQEKRTIRRTLPVLWREETLWRQMVRLIVQAAVEERSGQCGCPIITRGSYCELLDPCQPSRVV